MKKNGENLEKEEKKNYVNPILAWGLIVVEAAVGILIACVL